MDPRHCQKRTNISPTSFISHLKSATHLKVQQVTCRHIPQRQGYHQDQYSRKYMHIQSNQTHTGHQATKVHLQLTPDPKSED